jgi:serine protease Do
MTTTPDNEGERFADEPSAVSDGPNQQAPADPFGAAQAPGPAPAATYHDAYAEQPYRYPDQTPQVGPPGYDSSGYGFGAVAGGPSQPGQAYPSVPPFYPYPPTPPAAGTTSPPPARRRLWVPVAVVAALIGGLVGGGIIAGTRHDPTTTQPTGVVSQVVQPNTQIAKLQNVPAILAKVEPGVVSVHTNLGAGTGMILTADGQVLTNYHVIQGASSINVTLFNETKARTATVKGFDQSNDVAVLQITGASGLPTVQLGNSDSVQVGDDVIAVGNALNLVGGPTVTEGIISAKGRSVDPSAPQNLLQTDAAINPGNSGGPLVNADGQIVGMNTLVIQQANSQEAAQNLGFAIPINTIKPLVPDLAKGIQRTPGYLGVGVVTLTPDIAQRFGITVSQGAVVQDLPANGPAAQAGLQQSDVITSFDGQPVTSDSGLVQLIHNHKPGDRVTIGYVRGSTKGTVTVTLGSAPSQ